MSKTDSSEYNHALELLVHDLSLYLLDIFYFGYGPSDEERMNKSVYMILRWVFKFPSILQLSKKELARVVTSYMGNQRALDDLYSTYHCERIAAWLLDNDVRIILSLNSKIK